VSWSLFRWVWQLEGPLYVGMPPSGSLNRTRVYVPARAVWGALTAELARCEANGAEVQYPTVGRSLQDGYRFTYLFPAEVSGREWKTWLPTYQDGKGLAWRHEDDSKDSDAAVPDRAFRRRLLSTRPSTAINASTDAVEDGSLRETECIEAHWRNAGSVAMVGYVFIQVKKKNDKYSPEYLRIKPIDTIFVGGDTRYGLGRLRRTSFALEQNNQVFGSAAKLDNLAPQIKTNSVFAHAEAGAHGMSGALELLGGWDRTHGSMWNPSRTTPLWQPGSTSDGPVSWTVEANGVWKVPEVPT